MLINEHDSDLDELKEVKVKIPMGHHVKLHSMKVLTGKQISNAVTEALDLYFEEMPDDGKMADDVEVPDDEEAPEAEA